MRVFTTFLMLLMSVGGIMAQRDSIPEEIAREKLIRSTHVISVGQPDSTVSHLDSAIVMIGRFYADQFRNFQDPSAPYFMFMSKNAELAMGIGGVVRLRGWYGWNGALQTNGFSPYSIPIPKNPAKLRELDATPAGCAIYLNIMAHKPWMGYLNAYIEGNFDGYLHTGFKLKKAYVTLNDFTAGYVTSTYSDPAALAPTIDGAGSNGKIDRSNLLLRYMHTFKKGWTVAGSFEFPKSYITTTEGLTEKCSDYVPDLAAFAQYQWHGGLSHIRLSGLLRVSSYRDLLAERNYNVAGWGAMLSGMVKAARPLTLYASVSYGHGQGSYQGDLRIGNYDLVPDLDNPGRLYAPRSIGVTAGARYFFKSNIYAAGSFGTTRYYRKQKVYDAEYRQGIYGAVNIFWDLTPRLQVGAEYLVGKRTNFNHQHAFADRVDALLQFAF